MNIIEAIKDERLLGHFLGGNLDSWQPWLTALRVLYGLPVRSVLGRALVKQCTGRDPDKLPLNGFDTALFLTGRRSGKSRIAACIGAYESALAGHEGKLSKGERGVVPILAPSKFQSRIVTDYLRGVFSTPLLRSEVVGDTREGFELKCGTRIEILSGDWRTIRGYTCLAACIDEIAFFGLDAESKVKSDTELIRALKPALATVGGKLICISSPYARRGWCFDQYKRNFGNDGGNLLLWNAPSRTMNPTLPQSVVDAALAEDYASARAEYLGEFRDDVSQFLSRELIERLVVTGRTELMPQSGERYVAFVDVSGGRGDDATLSIAHRDDRTVVIDLLMRWRPPFSPHFIIGQMAKVVRRWGIAKVIGDAYGAEFTARAFEGCGVAYETAEKNKSELYAELLPRLCSGEIELLDNEDLVTQLASLERRTRSGGRDVIDHPPGGHDDLANAVAGVADVAARRQIMVGAWR